MKTEVYTINKGVNRPMVFRGLEGQYIWWLGGGLLGLLIGFAVLYISGAPPLGCVGVVGVGGGVLFRQVYRMSRKYGRYGLMKKRAARRLPRRIRVGSRRLFVSK